MADPIVNDPVPPEEDITKVQLWQRIDYTRSVIEQKNADIDAAMQGMILQLKSLFNDKIGSLARGGDDIKKSLVDEFRKEVANVIGGQTVINNKVDSLIKGNEAKIDQKMREFAASAENMVEDISSDLYSDISLDVKKLHDEFDVLKKNLNESLSAYQIESISKISALNEKLEKIQETLRGFLKSICG